LTGLTLGVSIAVAETHTVNLVNNCGHGTPTLIQGGRVLSTGQTVTINGPLLGAIAYLQTGSCGFNGEGCTLIETSLNGGYSSTDISLIAPHSFSVTSGFGYWGGCDNTGADCSSPGCNTAFHVPSDTYVQVGCSAANVNLAITFCL